MRNHLHVTTEIAASSLPVQDLGVDLARGDVVATSEILMKHPLVGAEVHVGFEAVIEDEYLAMPIWVQGATVDVEIPLHLDGGHRESLVLQEFRERTREDAFAETAHHGSDHRDISGSPSDVSSWFRAVPLGGLARFPKTRQEVDFYRIRGLVENGFR